MHIELTPEDEALLQEQVSKGHFASSKKRLLRRCTAA